MAKTRSQTSNITVKKEEEDIKDTQLLHSVNNTARNNKKMKRKVSRRKSSVVSAQEVKVEENTDVKPLLKSASKHSKLSKRQRVSQEQINQLIDYVVNHGMSVTEAARKANMSQTTAHNYYTNYKNDPEKKMPLPRNQRALSERFLTQEQVENLIRYIVDDKMSISKASAKANIPCESGRYYYKKYLNDPDHAIHLLCSRRQYTQDQKNEVIGYIVNDKMSIDAASRKAKMNISAGKKYCNEYFKQQHPDIPTPSHITYQKHYTQEQIKAVINYIIGDKMTLVAASKKANMSPQAAGRHYRQYLKDNNMELPVSKRYTQDEINKTVGYIVDDKMNITAASKKANISYTAAQRYFQRYVNEHNLVMSTIKFGKDKINEFIGYIVEDKMTIKAASKKANMSYFSGKKYYRKYLMDHNLPNPKSVTQDQKDEFIRYIADGKMTICAASKKANMNRSTGYKYYSRYLNNQKHSVPTRHPQVVSAPPRE